MTSPSPLQKRLDFIEVVYGSAMVDAVVEVLFHAELLGPGRRGAPPRQLVPPPREEWPRRTPADPYLPWLGREIARAGNRSEGVEKWASARLMDVVAWVKTTGVDLGGLTWQETRRREAAWARRQARYRRARGALFLELPEGWTWREIDSVSAFRRAGVELRNCLKDWEPRRDFKLGVSRVFVLRDEGDKARGSVEIRRRNPLDPLSAWTVSQVAGKANAPWPTAWAEPLRALSRALGIDPVDWQAATWAWDEETLWRAIRQRWSTRREWTRLLLAPTTTRDEPVGGALWAIRLLSLRGGSVSYQKRGDDLVVTVSLVWGHFREEAFIAVEREMGRLEKAVRRRVARKRLRTRALEVLRPRWNEDLSLDVREARFAWPAALEAFPTWAEEIEHFVDDAESSLRAVLGPAFRAGLPAQAREAVVEAAASKYPWVPSALLEAGGQERLPLRRARG